MDYTKIGLDEFVKRLGKRSVVEIRALLEQQGVALPAGTMEKEPLIRMGYEALCAQESAAANAAPAKDSGPTPDGVKTADPSPPNPPTQVDKKPSGVGRQFKIRCTRGTRWRCAKQWGNTYTTVRESEFTEAEWKALRADSSLQVIELAE